MKDFMDVIRIIPELFVNREFNLNQGFDDHVGMGSFCKTKYESFTVFKCTDAWVPICIFSHVTVENESVHLKPEVALFLQ